MILRCEKSTRGSFDSSKMPIPLWIRRLTNGPRSKLTKQWNNERFKGKNVTFQWSPYTLLKLKHTYPSQKWWLEVGRRLSFWVWVTFQGGELFNFQVDADIQARAADWWWMELPKKTSPDLRQKAFRLLGVPNSHRKTPMNVEDFGWILDVSAVHGIGLHSTLTPKFLFTTLTSIHIPPKPKGFIKKCPSTTIISESCSNVIGSMGLVYKTYSYLKNQPGTKVNMLVPWIPWPNHESWIMQQRHLRLLMEKTKNPAAAALDNDQYLSISHSCSN